MSESFINYGPKVISEEIEKNFNFNSPGKKEGEVN
jgi:hypothetical protein